MHKKLINYLHNIAFGIVSSVGNYYSNVENIHQGNLYLLPKHKNNEKRKRKFEKKHTKRSFTKQTLAMKSALHLSFKKKRENLRSQVWEDAVCASRESGALTKSSSRTRWEQELAPGQLAVLMVLKTPSTRDRQILFLSRKFPPGAIWHPQRSAGRVQGGLANRYRNYCFLFPYSSGFHLWSVGYFGGSKEDN